MVRKQLSLPQKVFVVKNYYQITDMFQVRKSFHKFYGIQSNEKLLDTFFNLVTQFERTGSVTQPAFYDVPEGKPKVEVQEVSRRGRGRPKKKLEELIEEALDDEDESHFTEAATDNGDGMDYFEDEDPVADTPQETGSSSKAENAEWKLQVSGTDNSEEITITLVPETEQLQVIQSADGNCEEVGQVQGGTEGGEGEEENDDEEYVPKPKLTKRAKKGSKKRVNCRICEKSYTQDFIKSHMIKHDREGCQYECEFCDEKFDRFEGLRIHEEGHIPVNKYKFACETCKEKFVSQDKLNLHMKSHAESKTFICEWCGMIFSTTDSLKVHRRTHTGEKPLKCKECNESFAFYGGLKSHMRKHSEGIYKCNYCEKTFIYKVERNLHHREHTGSKPFVCHVCGRGCATPHNLRSHMKILHKIEASLEEIQAQNFVGNPAETVAPATTTSTTTAVVGDTQHTIIVQTYQT